MKKRKQQSSRIGRRSVVALLVLAMLISVCVPGLTANASTVETEPTEAATSPVETTIPQETEPEETTAPVETETGDPAQDPEITAVYNQIMSYTDLESYWAFLDTMTDEEQDALFNQFTEEQQNAIWAHIDALSEGEQKGYAATADELYDVLRNTATFDALMTALNGLSDTEKGFLSEFSDAQKTALDDHITGLDKSQFATVTLTINQTIATNGRMSVNPSAAAPAGTTYVYTWQKNGENIDRTPYDIDGDGENIVYNVDENGAWVNAALIQGASSTSGEETEYAVRLTDVKIDALGKTYSVNNTNTATANSPYVAQLRNGSFETPVVVRQTMVDDRYENGLYWKTTDTTNHAIEIITELPNKDNPDTINGIVGYPLESQYDGDHNHDAYWHGVMFMPEGEQCAEINANDKAALYQDVMTIPGVAMNWAFDHMGRPVSSGAALGTNGTATDSMYVVIMPTSLALTAGDGNGQVDTLAEVEAVRTRINNNQPGYEGAKVIEISYSWVWKDLSGNDPNFPNGKQMYRKNADGSETLIYTLYNDRLYQHNDPWVVHEDTYKVPDNQYLTRFFFVANKTSSGNTTMGNHIDNVWFAQTPRPAESSTANLVIRKELVGLNEADIAAAKAGLSFTVKVNGTETTVEGIQLTWDGNVGTYSVSSGKFFTSSVAFSVSENVASNDNDKFALSTAAVVATGDNTNDTEINSSTKTASGRLTKGENETITFTNTYVRTVTDVTITKEVKGNMGDVNKAFPFEVRVTGGTMADATVGATADSVGYTVNSNVITFSLKDDEKVVIHDVPLDATLTVTESNNENYVVTTTVTGAEDTDENNNDSDVSFSVPDGTVTIAYTNTNDVTIDTGISMDSIPYILLVGVAAVGAIVLLLNKRRYTGKF